MTKTKEDLKGCFENGKVPSGADFSSLIESMVHEDEFDAWKKQGQISLGAGDSKWQLRVDKNGSLIVDRSPKDGESAADVATPADVGMAAWVAMKGRVGTHDPRAKVSGSNTSGMNAALLPSVPADGGWHPITDVPDGCYAFEIVAHMSGPQPTTAPGILQTLRRVSGLTRPHSAITHAIVTTTASGSGASIRQTAAPDSRAEWRRLSRWLLGIVLLLLVMALPMSLFSYGVLPDQAFDGWNLERTPVVDIVAENITAPILRTYETAIGAVVAYPYIAGGIGLLLGLYGVLSIVMKVLIHRSAIRLAWRKSPWSVLRRTATYALYLRGGHYPEGTSVKVHYHVTQLWG